MSANYPVSEEHSDQEPKPYHYYEQTLAKRIHHFYISGPVEEPYKYVDIVHKLQTASPDDVVYLHLNTPGGMLHTGVQLVNAMQSSNAHIITSVEAEAASLGTILFLAGDEFVVHDNSVMMFHNYSGGVSGKGHEQMAALDATHKWFKDVARRLYIPFLSEDEFDRMIKGEDLYIHSDDIRKRLNKMVKQLQKEQKQTTTPASKKKAATKKGT